jgi:DNA polymerase elongation subunit (family B)
MNREETDTFLAEFVASLKGEEKEIAMAVIEIVRGGEFEIIQKTIERGFDRIAVCRVIKKLRHAAYKR